MLFLRPLCLQSGGMKIKLSDERLGPLPDDQLDRLSRRDLLCLLRTEHRLRVHLEGYVSQLEDKVFELDGLYFRIKSKLFGRSSEKSKPPVCATKMLPEGSKGLSWTSSVRSAATHVSMRFGS